MLLHKVYVSISNVSLLIVNWKGLTVVDMSVSQFKDSQTAEAVDEYGIGAKRTRLRTQN